MKNSEEVIASNPSSISKRKTSFRSKSRSSFDRPLRKLSFQIKSNIDRISLPLKDIISHSQLSAETEQQSLVDDKPNGFLNTFQLSAKSLQNQKRVILNVGGVKHEGIILFFISGKPQLLEQLI
jgi:hypothetical protein